MPSFQLMIHGGSGTVMDKIIYREHIQTIIEQGQAFMAGGNTALDAVEYCVRLLEDDPVFNAGKGSVLNHEGQIEMDAAIMNGETLDAGCVAGISGVKNPITLAKRIMEHSQHVMLIGQGAMQFAKTQDLEWQKQEYFEIEFRREQWKQARDKDGLILDHSIGGVPEGKLGTVGAVARDKWGNLAAATSTGGIVNKRFGRVGDSPIVGAGVFAENTTCAVSATGVGEHFIKTTLAKVVAEYIRHTGATATEAAEYAIEYLTETVHGIGGIIVIDAKGNMAKAHSSPDLLFGQADNTSCLVGF